MKTCFLFTANTPQVAQSWLMLKTLRDPAFGAYEGDIWILSTSLSDAARAYLDAENIRYFERQLDWARKLMDWQAIGAIEPDLAPDNAFARFRNKRMSKLLYLDWYSEFGSGYDAVAVGDNDLYFQAPIDGVFELAQNGKLNYAQEHDLIAPGTSLWIKDFQYRRITGDWSFVSPDYEVNIGFFIAKPDVMNALFEDIKKRFIALPVSLIVEHSWHDQDLCRVNLAKDPEAWAVFDDDVILHLCGGGTPCVEERRSGRYFHRDHGYMPKIVHFGGGAWNYFAVPKRAFRVNPDMFFYPYMSDEVRAEADKRLNTSPE